MDKISIIFAKLSGLYKTVSSRVEGKGIYFDPPSIIEYFHQFEKLRDELKNLLPDLYSDFIIREMPKSSGTTDFDGRGYINVEHLLTLIRDIEYIFKVRSNSRVGEVIEKNKIVFLLVMVKAQIGI